MMERARERRERCEDQQGGAAQLVREEPEAGLERAEPAELRGDGLGEEGIVLRLEALREQDQRAELRGQRVQNV